RNEDESDEDEFVEDYGEDEIPKKTLASTSLQNRTRADEIERGFASASNYPFFRIVMHLSYLNNNYL
ncbi:hypothetical protein MKW94_026672, partial [Papaver nudicaule]|nr:hypothetical protein [Papaver nudicaule]